MKLSIRTRLLAFIVLAILGPILASGWFAYERTTALVLESASRDMLDIVQAASGDLDGLLGQAENDLLTLAMLPQLRDLQDTRRYGLKEEAAVLSGQLGGMLAGFIGRTSRYRSLAFLEPTGRRVVGAGPEPPAAEASELAARFSQAASGQVALHQLGAALLLVTAVSGKSDAPIGHLLCELNRSGLARMLSHVNYAGVGYAFLTDRQGSFLYHPLTEAMGRSTSEFPGQRDWGFGQLGRVPLADPPRSTELYRGDRWVVALRRLSRAPWGVGLAVQKDELLAKERAVGRQMLLALTFVLLLAIAVVSAISRRLTEPISRLVEGTHALAQGDLSVRVEATSGDELADLSETFNLMAGNLQEKEASIQQFIRDLRSTQGQLLQAEKLSAVGQLSAGIAHEINNPLGGIILSARIVERASGSAGVLDFELLRKHCGLIGANVSRAQEIIRALLDYSRKSAEELKLVPIDPNPLIEKTVLLLQHELKKRQFHSRLDSRGIIRTDATRLQQIVVNLLVNAVAATGPSGCVTLETADEYFTESDVRQPGVVPRRASDPLGADNSGRRLPVRAPTLAPPSFASGDPALRISVTDDGTGIHPDDLSRIFDPFFTTKPPGEGTGLGLSIVLGMVTAMDGCIHVDTELGRGTTMSIKFPVSHAGPQRGRSE
ncbi:MAG: sensor histidine kinase [Candidatus Wallbacteria bacterium]|nr:sensor histidine kinase [Candidatus Wallbacteria bacterium]